MKKYILIILAMLPLLFIYSCEDSISPVGDYSERYALYCIINTDTTFQTAYLSKSYKSDTFNPYDNSIDPALEGAVVTFKVNNRDIYSFSEGTTNRDDTSRYQTPLKYYFVDNYKPNNLDDIEITAVLTNGVVLKSALSIPRYSGYNMYSFYLTPYNPMKVGNSDLVLTWLFNDVSTSKDHSFNYKFQLVYSKAEDPDTKIKVVFPLYYSLNHDVMIPVYPKLTKGLTTKYSNYSIVKTLNSISEGDPNKNNYIIHECEFSNQLIEKNLVDYISSVEGFNDEFSIRIDPTEFSNIQNGFGIFGAYTMKISKIKIDKSFIATLGYRTSY